MYTYLGTGAISVAAIATWRVALRACHRPTSCDGTGRYSQIERVVFFHTNISSCLL